MKKSLLIIISAILLVLVNISLSLAVECYNCDSAKINNTYYFCSNTSDNICPQDFFDIIHSLRPNCNNGPNTCRDPDCQGQQQPGTCICYDCIGCKLNLTRPECSVVQLMANINTDADRCLDSPFSNKIFDCQNHIINGTKAYYSPGGAINFSSTTNATVKRCIINRFYYGMILGGNNNTIFNNTLNNSVGSGIYLRNTMNTLILNNTIINAGSSGIHSILSKSIIKGNRICNNLYYDLISGDYDIDWFGSSGDNNTCNKPDGWNDTSKIGQGGGCKYSCSGQQPQQTSCNVTNASIKLYCGNDNICDSSEEIQMNISVEDISKCKNINKMIVESSQGSTRQYYKNNPGGNSGGSYTGMAVGGNNQQGYAEECYVTLTKSFSPPVNPTQNFILGNWTVFISPSCAGAQDVELINAVLYNSTNPQKIIGSKDGSFGRITFSSESTKLYNLSIDTCGDTNLDGICENFNIKGNVNVDQESWGNAPQKRIIYSGVHYISFGQINNWFKPADILYNLNKNNSQVWGIYTNTDPGGTIVLVTAKNSTGQNINAEIKIINESNNHIFNRTYNSTSYKYTGEYPWKVLINFSEVYGYAKPTQLKIIFYSHGIYRFDYSYSPISIQPCTPCDNNGIKTQCDTCETSGLYRYCKNDNNHGTWINPSGCSIYPTDCCKSRIGYTCDEPSGTCKRTTTPQDCNTAGNSNNMACHSKIGCYWDKPIGLPGENPYTTFCKHCFLNEQGPDTCSDYHNETACNADECGVAYSPNCPGSTCSCQWSSGACRQSYSVTNPSNPNDCCSCSVSYGTCEQGCPSQENARLKTTICQKCEPLNTEQTCSLLPSSTECLACSFKTNKFPFFMPWQILIVIAILAAYYLLVTLKKSGKL
jgi:hypothetical protein